MEAILTLLGAGITGVLVFGAVFYAKKIEGYARKYSQTNPKLKGPFFQKFLIPMVTPVSMFLFTIIFVLLMSFILGW